ncbi:MAG: YabP/YqfC family sporulation protein [Clostridia bacterium]|nr:YabP/YqfC family sporulation protein [Clostridia bacterium]
MSKKSFSQFINEKFDIPLDAIASVPTAQMIGNTILSIDGCVGIKKYETEEIVIRTRDYMLKISGESLSMLTFSNGRVSIRGEISSYCVERVGK